MDTLRAMGFSARSEVATDDGFLSIDILLRHPELGRVAVEVDGPFHFFSNAPREYHGKALLRNRCGGRAAAEWEGE
jgi:hypothetical protein